MFGSKKAPMFTVYDSRTAKDSKDVKDTDIFNTLIYIPDETATKAAQAKEQTSEFYKDSTTKKLTNGEPFTARITNSKDPKDPKDPKESVTVNCIFDSVRYIFPSTSGKSETIHDDIAVTFSITDTDFSSTHPTEKFTYYNFVIDGKSGKPEKGNGEVQTLEGKQWVTNLVISAPKGGMFTSGLTADPEFTKSLLEHFNKPPSTLGVVVPPAAVRTPSATTQVTVPAALPAELTAALPAALPTALPTALPAALPAALPIALPAAGTPESEAFNAVSSSPEAKQALNAFNSFSRGGSKKNKKKTNRKTRNKKNKRKNKRRYSRRR